MKNNRFQLDALQLRRFEMFKEHCEQHHEIYQEEAAPMSPFLWTFRQGSISDVVMVYLENVSGPSVDLSLDDDGEWVKPYRKPYE